jgi:hypothetical protein
MGELYRTWVQEPGSRVWHGFTGNPDSVTAIARCGWEPDAMVSKTIWPAHPDDLGPPEFERCQWCVVRGTN